MFYDFNRDNRVADERLASRQGVRTGAGNRPIGTSD
jgi:hypothetical protein